MAASNPFFSVVIPLYNKESTISHTLRAVAKQDFDDFEVVVVDDGSTDQGPEIVKTFMQEEPRIRLIQQPNARVSAARNRGIEESTGPYVAFLDADDVWESEHLSELFALAKDYPEAGLLGTAYIRRMASPPGIGVIVEKLENKRGLVDNYFELVKEAQFIYTSSISIPRWALAEQGGFPIEEKYCSEDLNLWARIAANYAVAYSGKLTVNYDRAVPGQATASVSNLNQVLFTHIFPRSLQSLADNQKTPEKLKAQILDYAEHYLFHCCLIIILSVKGGAIDQMDQFLRDSDVESWIRSKRICFIQRHPRHAYWKLYFYARKLLRSRRFVGLCGGRISRNGIKLRAIS